MNKINLYLMAALMAAVFSISITSCSKDDEENSNEMTVKNLTGIDWYDSSIVFKESMNSDSKIIKMVKIGDVGIGNTFSTTKEASYFYIDARNKRGKLFMSKILYSSDNVSVKSSDILVNL